MNSSSAEQVHKIEVRGIVTPARQSCFIHKGGSVMRKLLSVSLALAVALVFAGALRAEEKKEVTLKGEILCAKCELKEAKRCTTAIVVKEDGKDITYYFKDKGNKETYHEDVCGGGRKEGTVTGTVTEKDGKKYITPSKVEYAKK